MRLAARAGKKKAKVALARKLAVILHRMLASGAPSDAVRQLHPGPSTGWIIGIFGKSWISGAGRRLFDYTEFVSSYALYATREWDMVEKSVQTYIRAPNGDLYCIDEEGQAFRSVRGLGAQVLETAAQSTHACHAMPDHVGAQIVPEADLPGPEGAHILPDGMGANIVPDHMATDTVPDGIGAHIVPDGVGQTIRHS